ITRLLGKWKTSQNQPDGNRAGVVRGLRASGTSATAEMATLVEALTPRGDQ
ncbi:MAG TPA: FMN-binding negative transcriptional regulator, partial [Accumulibacter sp.]|nr:FMN-binding negative transcriptional regulator [Accumulibacter sp.]